MINHLEDIFTVSFSLLATILIFSLFHFVKIEISICFLQLPDIFELQAILRQERALCDPKMILSTTRPMYLTCVLLVPPNTIYD